MPLRRVPVAVQHEALCFEPLHEHVADGVEGGEVRPRDDELRKLGRGKGVQVDLRLPRAALDDQRPRTLLELVGAIGARAKGQADQELSDDGLEPESMSLADIDRAITLLGQH